MSYENGEWDSDSVNLGSNPGPPATTNTDVSCISEALTGAEQSERTERTAHIGRTEVGTARVPARYRAQARALAAKIAGEDMPPELAELAGRVYLTLHNAAKIQKQESRGALMRSAAGDLDAFEAAWATHRASVSLHLR